MSTIAPFATVGQICQKLHRAWQVGGLSEVTTVLWSMLLNRIVPARRSARRRFKEELRQDLAFDEEHRVSTAGDVPLSQVGLTPSQVARGNAIYRPIWRSVFRAAIDELAIEHGLFTFIDYGSGKGKALLLATEYPWKRIIGVEYAPDLHLAAVENLRTFVSDSRRCQSVVAIRADALQYDPPAEPLVIFIFNSFPLPLLHQILVNLGESVWRHPRPVLIVSVNIRVRETESVFLAHSNLEMLHRTKNHLILRVGPRKPVGSGGLGGLRL